MLVTEERRAGRRAGQTAGRGEGQFALLNPLSATQHIGFPGAHGPIDQLWWNCPRHRPLAGQFPDSGWHHEDLILHTGGPLASAVRRAMSSPTIGLITSSTCRTSTTSSSSTGRKRDGNGV